MQYEVPSAYYSVSDKFCSDLFKIGLLDKLTDATLKIKPYSKSFFGRYFFKDKRINIYMCSNKDLTSVYAYPDLLKTMIHEACHHIQYHNGTYVRRRGVMHDSNFWKLYNHYIELAVKEGILNSGHRIEKQR